MTANAWARLPNGFDFDRDCDRDEPQPEHDTASEPCSARGALVDGGSRRRAWIEDRNDGEGW